MKIAKRPAKEIKLEPAHGVIGARKLLVDQVAEIEAMTDGFLPVGAEFDWHDPANIWEVMYVLAGTGKVLDREGEHDYAVGDFFTFPPDTQHKIVNTGDVENRMIFVRTKNKEAQK